MHLSPLGDTAVVVSFGNEVKEAILDQVWRLTRALESHPPLGVVDVVPAYSTVTVFYDLTRIDGYDRLCHELTARAQSALTGKKASARKITIPVCYDPEFGPDLEMIADRAKLSVEKMVKLHSGTEYVVAAIGFVPGFPYFWGLPEILHTPRREKPRPRVVPGSVGIGGAQTGVYPLETPGGWHLLGRTPLQLFRPNDKDPTLLRASDRIKIRRITRKEFDTWK